MGQRTNNTWLKKKGAFFFFFFTSFISGVEGGGEYHGLSNAIAKSCKSATIFFNFYFFRFVCVADGCLWIQVEFLGKCHQWRLEPGAREES